MPNVDGDVKRRTYRSARRREQAEQTRARVLDAAASVFRERGYERASVAAIAATAGVAEETVYAHFRNKRTLLGELVQRAVRGADPRAVPDQDVPHVIAATEDRSEQLRLFAEDISARLERAAPLVAVVAAAAPGEPELAQLLRVLHAHRLRNLGGFVDDVAAHGELALGRKSAVDTVWALTSPELYQLLTGVHGWNRRRYAAWLRDCLSVLLLGRD
jgi:AcrR family transcriptional regulator